MENNDVPAPKEIRRRSPSLKRAETKKRKEELRGFPLPLELTCPVTKKTVKYTSLTYIRSLLQKHGSLEKLYENYISSEGKEINSK